MTNESKRDPMLGASAPQVSPKQAGMANLVDVLDPNEPTRIADIVDEASNDSFPASDPPGWTLGVDPK